MDKDKVYILQKDLPDYKAGEEFYFDGRYYKASNPCDDGVYGRWPGKYVEDNPEWFKLKEEKPTVEGVYSDPDGVHYWIQIYEENHLISKERLAEILMKESINNWKRESNQMSEEDVIAPKQKAIINGCQVSPFEDVVNKKVYSQKEYLQFGEECFNAARKNNSEWYYKYKSFSDFMNSQKEEK